MALETTEFTTFSEVRGTPTTPQEWKLVQGLMPENIELILKDDAAYMWLGDGERPISEAPLLRFPLDKGPFFNFMVRK